MFHKLDLVGSVHGENRLFAWLIKRRAQRIIQSSLSRKNNFAKFATSDVHVRVNAVRPYKLPRRKKNHLDR